MRTKSIAGVGDVESFFANAADEVRTFAGEIASNSRGAAAQAIEGAFPALRAVFGGVAAGAATVASFAGVAGALLALAAELEKLGARPATPEEMQAINADKESDMPGQAGTG